MGRLERDGVALFYEEAGEGSPPLVMVHGWGCDRTYFAPQFEYFRDGHRVVSVDLRGHGESDEPEQDYTMEVFADDVAWLCGELGLAKPVLIGHSMGGIVAFDLACRYPQLPAAAIMLDAAVVLPDGAKAAIPGMVEKLRGSNYREVLREYVENALFIPTDDPERKARIIDGMTSAPHHVLVAAMEGLRDYDAAAVAEGVEAPLLYIAADEPQPRSDMARFHRLCPSMTYGQTVGSGHFCQLEVPEQVTPMVERFLEVSGVESA